MAIEVRNVDISFAKKARRIVLSDVSFRVEDGEFLVIIGPSGCGKSTILGAIAGFIEITGGSITKNSMPIVTPGSDRAIMLQQNSLFPWLNAKENVEYPLKVQGKSPQEREVIATQWLVNVGLEQYSSYYPTEMSIGMQQRVALARLFAGNADVLLMDEPFASMDTVSRIAMHKVLLHIWEHERRTVVFVTHDVEEALILADRILIFGGEPTSVGAVHSVRWERPRSLQQLFDPEFIKERRELLELIGAMTRHTPPSLKLTLAS